MKICLKCNRGLFDRDIQCDKCGCTDIMDKKEYQVLYENFKNSSVQKQQKLRQSSEYQIICKYKFLIDEKNTPEMRKEQSEKDKQRAKQESDRYYAELQHNARQRQLEQQRIEKQQNTPKCPICQSTNLSKITTVQKAGKIALFGIFGMGDNGKTWKCNNCGSKF